MPEPSPPSLFSRISGKYLSAGVQRKQRITPMLQRGNDFSLPRCNIAVNLCFLHSLQKKGLLPSTIQVYLAAMPNTHSLPCWDRWLATRQDGSGLRTYALVTMLVTMLDALRAAPFEPFQHVGLKFLSLKIALLVALVSA